MKAVRVHRLTCIKLQRQILTASSDRRAKSAAAAAAAAKPRLNDDIQRNFRKTWRQLWFHPSRPPNAEPTTHHAQRPTTGNMTLWCLNVTQLGSVDGRAQSVGGGRHVTSYHIGLPITINRYRISYTDISRQNSAVKKQWPMPVCRQ